MFLSVLLAVAYEGSKLAGVHMIMNRQKVFVRKLESLRKLSKYLPGSVNKLGHYGRNLFRVTSNESTSVIKLMTKNKPVFFNQGLETLNCPVEWI